MARTINGKTIQQVLEELQAPIGKMGVKGDQVYYPTYLIRNRLDEVCGLNWSFVLTNGPSLMSMDGVLGFVADGKIVLYDDEGRIVSERAAGKGVQLKYPKVEKPKEGDAEPPVPLTPKPMNPGNDAAACSTTVFKKCAEAFGVGDDLNEMSTEVYDRDTAKAKALENKGKGRGKDLLDYHVKLNSGFTSFGTTTKADCEDAQGNKFQLVIWKNDREKLGDQLDMLMAAKKGQNVYFKGYPDKYRDTPQLILQQFKKIA